ncbi:MAG: NAD(P)H-binding protein [Sulfitobacter sp.]|nr:NAD(P)H-binding protein [Sulfitobacter sp.]
MSGVVICGATGTAGRATARALRDAGYRTTALGRSPARIDGIEDITCDLADPDALAATLAKLRPDAVVSCLASRTGLPQDAWAIDHAANTSLIEATARAGGAQFVLLSAICVQKPRLAFQRAKLASEAVLVGSGLTYSIVRPTAFFKSLSGQLDRLRRGKPYLMFGDGQLTACTPISDADLGLFIVSCLENPARQNRILPIGGPGPALTPREMGAALFEVLGQEPRYRRVTPRLFPALALPLSLAGRFSSRAATKAELARIGHYYATESMLVWDAERNRYDAGATPSFGSDLLIDHYRDLAAGRTAQDRGAHAVF